MTETKPSFAEQVKSYPKAFWVANTMEIFERMAWYGWFTVMAVYVTGSVATGGLGFSTELAGALQGIVPFFLYLLPVVTGALADRYGYKKMFIIAYLVMMVSYYLLGQFHTVPTFFMAFMFVAVGAAIFKPVVVGTVARTTNESNSATGFGIFYMMVNVGGFAGPIVAGLVRGKGWEYVFMACSAWSALNLLIVLFFYKEPAVPGAEQEKRSLRQVGDNMVEVLGNMRFFITVFTVVFALMFANLNVWWFAHFTWLHCLFFIPGWLVLNFVWDVILPPGSGDPAQPASQGKIFLFKRMHCSNWRFALFLLIMSGFWTSFNQIFYTMPEYLRDFTETRPLVEGARWIETTAAYEWLFGVVDPNNPDEGLTSRLATVSPSERDELIAKVQTLKEALGGDQRALLSTIPRERFDQLLEAAPVALREAVDAARVSAEENHDAVAAFGEMILSLEDSQIGQIIAVAQVELGTDWREQLEREAKESSSKKLLHSKVRISPSALQPYLAMKPQVSAEQLKFLGETVERLAASKQALAESTDNIEAPVLLKKMKKQFEAAQPPLREQGMTLLPIQMARLLLEDFDDTSSLIDAAAEKVRANEVANQIIIAGRQVNPEYIVNINAGAIVLFQVLISLLMGRFHRFTTMIVGMLIAAVGVGLSTFAGAEGLISTGGLIWIVAGGIFVFSFGEMMASPTSQEYVGRIAPAAKKALYMGYYFIAVALGNVFAGILKGELMSRLAYDMNRPDLMWAAFGGIMLLTAVAFLLYNKFALPKDAAHKLVPGDSGS